MKTKLHPQRANTGCQPMFYYDDPDAIERLCDDLETLDRLQQKYNYTPTGLSD